MTTPSPVYSSNSLEETPHEKITSMPYPDRARYRAAANRARKSFPGAVGELVARELHSVEEFGWALGANAFSARLLRDVEGIAPAEQSVAAQSATRGPAPSP